MAGQQNPVGWFEIPVSDMVRAVKFYEAAFGVKLAPNKMGPMDMAWWPMVKDGPQATGSLVKAQGYEPSKCGTIVYFSVEDIEGTLARIKAGGGKVVMPKMGIGEYGFVAQFEDSEGNRVALHSLK